MAEILGSRTLLQYEEAVHKEVTLSANIDHSEPSHVYQSGPPVAPTTQYSRNTSLYIARVKELLSGINVDDLLEYVM